MEGKGGGLNGDGGQPKTRITPLFHSPETHWSIRGSIRPKPKSIEIGGGRRDLHIVGERFGEVTSVVDGPIRFFGGRE
ncbi:hypothetical protein M5689_019561 [Euphorbia peplus]|nr:hypothetical protein M5689_019561 [Euphorbia peplus]